MRLPDVPTVASLDARGEVDLDEENRARLLRMVGEPVGPQGIPKRAVMSAGLVYLGSVSLPVLTPLVEMGLWALARWGIASWLRPLLYRRMARSRPPGREAQQWNLASLNDRLVRDSPFLRFHRRQALVLGLALVVLSVATCGVGLVLGAVPHTWFCYTAWRHARAGEWYLVPWIGERLIRPFLAHTGDAPAGEAG